MSSRHLQSTPDYSPQVHKKGRGCPVHRLGTRHQPLESSTPAPESNTDTRHAVHLDTSSILSAQTSSPRGQTSRGCRHKQLLDTSGGCKKSDHSFLLFFFPCFLLTVTHFPIHLVLHPGPCCSFKRLSLCSVTIYKIQLWGLAQLSQPCSSCSLSTPNPHTHPLSSSLYIATFLPSPTQTMFRLLLSSTQS